MGKDAIVSKAKKKKYEDAELISADECAAMANVSRATILTRFRKANVKPVFVYKIGRPAKYAKDVVLPLCYRFDPKNNAGDANEDTIATPAIRIGRPKNADMTDDEKERYEERRRIRGTYRKKMARGNMRVSLFVEEVDNVSVSPDGWIHVPLRELKSRIGESIRVANRKNRIRVGVLHSASDIAAGMTTEEGDDFWFGCGYSIEVKHQN